MISKLFIFLELVEVGFISKNEMKLRGNRLASPFPIFFNYQLKIWKKIVRNCYIFVKKIYWEILKLINTLFCDSNKHSSISSGYFKHSDLTSTTITIPLLKQFLVRSIQFLDQLSFAGCRLTRHKSLDIDNYNGTFPLNTIKDRWKFYQYKFKYLCSRLMTPIDRSAFFSSYLLFLWYFPLHRELNHFL